MNSTQVQHCAVSLPLISLREGISIVATSCSVSTNTHGINASLCDCGSFPRQILGDGVIWVFAM